MHKIIAKYSDFFIKFSCNLTKINVLFLLIAEMSEWSNVLVSKTGIPKGIMGSNPIPSAKYNIAEYLYL